MERLACCPWGLTVIGGDLCRSQTWAANGFLLPACSPLSKVGAWGERGVFCR